MIGKAPKVVSTAGLLSLKTSSGSITAEKVGWKIMVNGKFVMYCANKEKAKAYMLALSQQPANQLVTMETAEEYTAVLQ